MSGATPTPADLSLRLDEGSEPLARTYAEALLDAAEADDQGEAAVAELEEVVEDVWKGQPEFAALLASGTLGAAATQRVVAEVFEPRASAVVFRFLSVLARRDRLAYVPMIARSAREIWDRKNRRVKVVVRSAVPLDDALRRGLRERLDAMLEGQTPVFEERVEPELIGGLVVQVGDRLYDASVRRQLDQLRHGLLTDRIRELRRRGDLVAG